MRTRVKICGITRPEDAREAVRQGADAIGLVFYPPSPRAVSIEQAQRISAVLPPFVTLVGLFVNEPEAGVRGVLARVPVGLLQFHG
ncbi:MAG: N-(5'-phosphoribosyl)anthranilate isomerase, partial [Candidatus Sedimenticola endophacoides]